MSQTAYVVTDGCYSDFHNVAVFLDKEQAELYVLWRQAHMGGGDVDLEDYIVGEVPQTISFVRVIMDKEGNVVEAYPSLGLCDSCGTHGTLLDYHRRPQHRVLLSWFVATEDKTGAIKAANEKRSQLIALGIWDAAEKKLKEKGCVYQDVT